MSGTPTKRSGALVGEGGTRVYVVHGDLGLEGPETRTRPSGDSTCV